MATSPTTDVPEATTGQHLLLRGIAWEDYLAIAQALSGRHVRLTFDRGTLEFMTISPLHGHLSRLLAQIIFVLTEELGLPRKSFGDMTLGREDLERGLEPDECFYITHEPEVRNKDHLDLASDPPPDLAVEIDVTHSPRNRLAIYAALGVKEVWRFHDETLTAQSLDESGEYQTIETSHHFPGFKITDVMAFLNRRNETDENTLIREFREWVRKTLVLGDS
jgi:Uma2 family endonuclease